MSCKKRLKLNNRKHKSTQLKSTNNKTNFISSARCARVHQPRLAYFLLVPLIGLGAADDVAHLGDSRNHVRWRVFEPLHDRPTVRRVAHEFSAFHIAWGKMYVCMIKNNYVLHFWKIIKSHDNFQIHFSNSY